jgi:hypothetical protein
LNDRAAHPQVLIITTAQDAHAAAVGQRLEALRVGAVCWELEQFPHAAPLSIHLGPESPGSSVAVLGIGERPVALNNVRSVWMRRGIYGLFAPSDTPDDLRIFLGLEYEAAFRGVVDALRHARWVNPPESLYKVEPSLYQLDAAAKLGFPVRRTVITNDPEHVNGSGAEHGAPAMLQEQIEAEADVRVFVAGDRIFPTGDIPHETAALCHRLVSEADLVFACVHLLRTGSGQHVFVSLQANPDWLDLPALVAEPVTAAVTELLAGPVLQTNSTQA